jgi:radical SAM family uncharacterized protein/radical SAM-linked protein
MSEDWTRSILEKCGPTVEKPGRYTGGEWNEIRKNPSAVRTKVALAFPDVYEIGMSYLGQKILYSLINARPSCLAERVFAPWPDFERELRMNGDPLRSLENKLPLSAFDILGFSLLYELNYSNILTILDLGGIPFSSMDRGTRHPLVIAGGPAAFNPEPVAGLFDLFLLGDGEEGLLEIIDKDAEMRSRGASRKDRLRELARIPGVYVPTFYESYVPDGGRLQAVRPMGDVPAVIQKRVLRSFSRSHFPEDIIVPNVQAVFDRVAVEVARGCPQKCRFCQATSLYAPFRVKDPSFVVEKIFKSLRATGYEDASLFSLSVSDYPYLGETIKMLMERLEKDHVSLSLSSLRPKGLSADIVRNIIKVRKTGFTLVPEAGSERLRRVINKNLNDQDLWEASANAFREGWKLLKLYFMIGLPTETEEDILAIVALVDKLTALGRGILSSPPRIHLSISPFIPKPHTPFQWVAMEDRQTLLEKKIDLGRLLKKRRNVQVKEQPIENSVLEAVFSRGDRRLTKVLINAWTAGARFDSWKDHFQFSPWMRAFEDAEVDFQDYLGEMDRKVPLPWDHIHTGIGKRFLSDELDRALRAETSPSCLETTCGACRGCDFRADVERAFIKTVDADWPQRVPLGVMTETVFRYQAFYAKNGPARFISHNDLLNVLQRSFKRAGVDVVYSEGFHPKMQMSFPPALPLGMRGNEESLEFKSRYELGEREFVSAVNRHAPEGIRFLGLKKIESAALSLTERIVGLVYSVDLTSEAGRRGMERTREEKNLTGSEGDVVMHLAQKVLFDKPELLEEISFDEAGRKIFLRLAYNSRKSLRPQDIVADAFGLQDAVYFMTRERMIYR